MKKPSITNRHISENKVISVSNISKIYKLYPSNSDRLKEALNPFRKRYHREYFALNDMSFDIGKGDTVGILGRNGAGKSTLLQLIAGVIFPTSGNIEVNGKVSALLELGAGLNPDLSGRDNIILSKTINGTPQDLILEQVAEVEEFADIGVFFDQPLKVYSSGMYARIAFANAINIHPQVLIIDEILGVGDAKFQEKCYNKIHSLKEAGVSILFVSHSTEVIQRNCDYAILLENGKLLKYDKTDAVVAMYRDLLYGSNKFENVLLESKLILKPEKSISSKILKKDNTLNAFLESNSSYINESSYYNSYERRIGNRDVEIVDILVSADDNYQFNVLSGSEKLKIYLKIKYNKNVAEPQIGWALVNTEGLVIAGSNTEMQSTVLASAQKGEIIIYTQEIKLSLCGGNYFISLGIGESKNRVQEWTHFDLRNSVLYIPVSESLNASGFFKMPSSCCALK